MKFIKVVSSNENIYFIKFDSIRCLYINKEKNKIIIEVDGLKDSEDITIDKNYTKNFDEIYKELLLNINYKCPPPAGSKRPVGNIEDSNTFIRSW